MTKQSISCIGVYLTSILIVSNSLAQTSEIKNLHPALMNAGNIRVYDNILTEFQQLFMNAENVSWEKVNKNYLAKFSIGDQKQRALLNPKGELLYKISYGTEKHLPTGIRKMAKKEYVEFLITSAVLVEEANRKIWVINLEDDLNYVTVSIENDLLQEVGKYIKR